MAVGLAAGVPPDGFDVMDGGRNHVTRKALAAGAEVAEAGAGVREARIPTHEGSSKESGCRARVRSADLVRAMPGT